MRANGETGTARVAVAGTALAVLLFLAGSYVAPLLDPQGDGWLFRVYAPVCHQYSERCFAVGAGHQALCARCAGLYWGGAAGLIVAACFVIGRRRGPRPIWLAYAVAPTLVDALLPWIGLPGLSSLPRCLLALPAGFVAGLFLAEGIRDIVSSLKSNRSRESMGLGGEPCLEESDG